MNALVAEIGLSEARSRYVGFYQETADFFNGLLQEGGSLAQRIESTAAASGLAVHSTLERKVPSLRSATEVKEHRDVAVSLPDAGKFNRLYIREPKLYVNEWMTGQEITFLQVNFRGQGGTKIRYPYGQGPTSINWHHERQTPEGMRVEPSIKDARWIARNLIDQESRIDTVFRPAEALANALRGIVGEFIER